MSALRSLTPEAQGLASVVASADTIRTFTLLSNQFARNLLDGVQQYFSSDTASLPDTTVATGTAASVAASAAASVGTPPSASWPVPPMNSRSSPSRSLSEPMMRPF